jgi:hypothetical protein
MLTYIAAVAAAVTVMISPTPVRAEPPQRPAVRWMPPTELVRINERAQVSTTCVAGRAPYVLTVDEQRVLRRALFRSARILA